VAGVIQHLDVEHGGQAAQALGADAQRVDLFHQFEAQFLGAGEFRTRGGLGFQFMDVHRRHDRLLGQQHGLFRRAADADAEDAGRAPAGTHGRHGFQHPIDNRVGGVQCIELGFILRAAALGGADYLDVIALDHFVMNHRRGVVLAVSALASRVEQH